MDWVYIQCALIIFQVLFLLYHRDKMDKKTQELRSLLNSLEIATQLLHKATVERDNGRESTE